MKKRTNCLLEKIAEIMGSEPKGKLIDLGCGDGDYSKRLKDLDFEVIAADIDTQRFRYKNDIEFKECDVTKKLLFPDESFDYVLFLEIIEHLRNPYTIIEEVNRILKKGGKLILSTPNILNPKSRIRFLFEGAYEYFREPPLDQVNNPKEKIFNLHLFPYRFHELEYLLWEKGFKIEAIFTSIAEGIGLSFLYPLIRLQLFVKGTRSKRKKGIDYSRINRIMLSREVLFGRHLIIEASKR